MSGGYVDPKKLAEFVYIALPLEKIFQIINSTALDCQMTPDFHDKDRSVAVAHYNDGIVDFAAALRERFQTEAEQQ